MPEVIIEHAVLNIYDGSTEIIGTVTKGAGGIYTFSHRSSKLVCQFRLKRGATGWFRYRESNIIYPQDHINQIGKLIDFHIPDFKRN